MPTDGAMPKKMYRLGNQSTEYELETQYVGWSPEGYEDWDDFARKDIFKLSSEGLQKITITSPDKKRKVTLILDHAIVKDAFPMSFFGEERSKKWWRFYIVSTEENPDKKFIIPLY